MWQILELTHKQEEILDNWAPEIKQYEMKCEATANMCRSFVVICSDYI